MELPLLYNNTVSDKQRRERAEQALEQVGLKDRRKSIVFVTHEPDIATFTERTILLNDGRIVKDERVETQSARQMLEAIMV
ncbi:hypothetical protein FACS189413_07010 [Bacteroidia bacterium]|nr:hypothetical protein FACS189413_07010 [Bacteroidia bacterium]